jgi:uncharacterized protein
MNKLVVASTGNGAGKTSIIAGLAQVLGGKSAYIKPIGDRLLYRKKRLWDHDAALFALLWQMEAKPEDITIGFEHAKLRYMYDRSATEKKITDMIAAVGQGRDHVFIEAGNNLEFGSSVHLDAISLAKFADAPLLLVLGGGEASVLDEIHFFKNYIDDEGAKLAGIVINRVDDLEDFHLTYQEELAETGLPILGVLPRETKLEQLPVRFLVERLFARVVAGESGLDRVVENLFLGAMSVSSALGHPLFEKPNKLIITSGDRSDMILAAIETDASCVVLSNNLLPPGNILAKASAADIPVLMVPWDTFTTVQKVVQVEPLLTIEDQGKLELVKALVADNFKTDALFGG